MPTTTMLTTDDGEMALYEAEPGTSEHRAVIVVQEAFGVNEHIEDVCRRFAAEGYRAVAPHLFYRTGDPVLDYVNFEKIVPHIQALSEAGLAGDLDATLGHLAERGIDESRTAIVGFCMGGTIAFLTAARHRLAAAATFYGGGVAEGRFGMPSLVDLAPRLQTPWLGLYGDLDQGIPVEQVEALRVAVAGAPVAAEVVRYEEAGHGFHCDARDSYHEPSARDAWRRTLSWFQGHMPAS
jgi:carboxymethylenebutenolidase